MSPRGGCATPRAGLTVDRIVEEAARMADQKGLHEVTLLAVARRLRVQPPSIYKHVDGLPEIRRRLALMGLEELHGTLSAATVGRSGDEAVRALCGAFRAFATQRPGLYAATVEAPPKGDRDRGRAAERVLQLVLASLSSYRMPPGDSIHAVRGLRAALHGFVSLEAGRGFGLPDDVDESFRRLVEGQVANLRARAGG